MFHHAGTMADLDINLPVQPLEVVSFEEGRPRYLSTLNSDRISLVLSKSGVNMENIPVVDLVPLLEHWPADFLNAYEGKASWPYLVLTSPFAAKCAVKAAASNADIGRIPWLAIGEGTARACFRLGVTVAACARAANAKELAAYICDRFEPSTGFLIPRQTALHPNSKPRFETQASLLNHGSATKTVQNRCPLSRSIRRTCWSCRPHPRLVHGPKTA